MKTFTLVVNPAEHHPPVCPPWLKHRLQHVSWYRLFHEDHSRFFWHVIKGCFEHTHHHGCPGWWNHEHDGHDGWWNHDTTVTTAGGTTGTTAGGTRGTTITTDRVLTVPTSNSERQALEHLVAQIASWLLEHGGMP